MIEGNTISSRRYLPEEVRKHLAYRCSPVSWATTEAELGMGGAPEEYH